MYRSWNHSFGFFGPTTLHRVRFSRPCLPVSEDTNVVPLQCRLNQRLKFFKYFFLRRFRREDLVKTELLTSGPDFAAALLCILRPTNFNRFVIHKVQCARPKKSNKLLSSSKLTNFLITMKL